MHAEHFELHAADFEDLMTMDFADDDAPTPRRELSLGDRVRVLDGAREGELGTVTGFGPAGSPLVKLDCLGFEQPGLTVRKLNT